jgi:hypothetical protein
MTLEERIAAIIDQSNACEDSDVAYLLNQMGLICNELQAENEKLKEKLETAKSHIMEAKYYLDQNGLDEQDKKNGLDFIDEAINLLNNNQNNNE